MTYSYQIQGVTLRTGDILCNTDGQSEILAGEFWRLLGRLLPGVVDHIVLYLGPEGRCIEAGPLGVITFDVQNHTWDAQKMMPARGMLVDSLYGIARPLEALALAPDKEEQVRQDIARYCLAQVGKPYNLNFFNCETEDGFYCSQLAYKAFQRHGINLNTNVGIINLPGTNQIIFPQEIWDACPNRQLFPRILKGSQP